MSGLAQAVPWPFSAALTAGTHPQAAMLACRPWLPAGPHHPSVAAMLLALHAPAEVAALTASAPDSAAVTVELAGWEGP